MVAHAFFFRVVLIVTLLLLRSKGDWASNQHGTNGTECKRQICVYEMEIEMPCFETTFEHYILDRCNLHNLLDVGTFLLNRPCYFRHHKWLNFCSIPSAFLFDLLLVVEESTCQ